MILLLDLVELGGQLPILFGHVHEFIQQMSVTSHAVADTIDSGAYPVLLDSGQAERIVSVYLQLTRELMSKVTGLIVRIADATFHNAIRMVGQLYRVLIIIA
jgi:hypothetical protein